MANFQLGQKFSSFLEFKNCLSSYERENFVKFYKRDSRKIESAIQSRKTKGPLNANLTYFEIKYHCVRGGPFRVTGKGIRRTSSRKIECPAHISLRAAADGKSLEVKKFDSTHNHEVSKELYDRMSHQRRLSESQKNRARELIRLQDNKKLIQQKIQKETGKFVTMKDLSNLAKSVKINSNDLEEAVSVLQEEYCNAAHWTDIENPDWVPTQNIYFESIDNSVEADVLKQKQTTIDKTATKETGVPISLEVPTSPSISETEEIAQYDELLNISLSNSPTLNTITETPSKRPRVYVLYQGASPKRTCTARSPTKEAKMLIDRSKNKVENDRVKSDYEEIEQKLRVEWLQKQIELVQNKIDVQKRLLEMLDKNPEKLILKF